MAVTASWLKRHTITIDYTKVSTANQTDFPVLLSNGNFLDDCYANTQSAGQDLRFTSDAAGATELPFEIVSWNTGAKTAEVYVKIPTLSYTANTIFYVWYSNAAASAYGETDTFGKHNTWDSNFDFVHHMNGASETALDDSTSNNRDITNKDGTPTFNATAKWGLGVNFGGNSDVYIPTFNYATSNVTVLVVYKSANLAGTQGVVSIGRGGNGFAIYPNGSGSGVWSVNTAYGADCGGNNSTANWFFYVGSYNGTNARAYLNGAYVAQAAGAAPGNNASCDIVFGALLRSSNYANGIVEEIRYSKVQRADDWITTEYNNLNSPSTFATGSAISYSQIFTDTITVSEIFTKGITKILNETSTITDSIVKSVGRLFNNDTLTLSEIFSTVHGLYLTITETITISDTITKAVSRILNDVQTVTDSIVKGIVRLLPDDVITITDSVAKGMSVLLSDTITVVDSITRGIGKVLSETVTLTEDFIKTTSRNFTDTISLTDIFAMIFDKFGTPFRDFRPTLEETKPELSSGLTQPDNVTSEADTPRAL